MLNTWSRLRTYAIMQMAGRCMIIENPNLGLGTGTTKTGQYLSKLDSMGWVASETFCPATGGYEGSGLERVMGSSAAILAP